MLQEVYYDYTERQYNFFLQKILYTMLYIIVAIWNLYALIKDFIHVTHSYAAASTVACTVSSAIMFDQAEYCTFKSDRVLLTGKQYQNVCIKSI